MPIVQDPNAQVDLGAAVSAWVVSFLINTPITMLLYKAMIPTETFGKAALVWLIQLVIVICIALIILALVFGIGLALGGL